MKKIFWQFLIPQHLISQLFGFLAKCRIFWLKNLLIKWFIKHYKISMEDALEPNVYNYPNLESFFIRKTKKNSRIFAEAKDDFASPCDGKISQFGKIEQNLAIQAKGIKFDIVDLLGGEEKIQRDFQNGEFITIYLAPKNYHRIYMPCPAILQKIIYIPGKLFAVNSNTTKGIPNLFPRNERMILFFKNENGPFALVLVGALIVSGIHTEWTRKEPTKTIHGKIKIWDFSKKKVALKTGAEIGYFTFGSTVIATFPKNSIIWNKRNIKLNQPILMGKLLGKFKKSPKKSI